jgi:hypothetical protein
MEGMKREIFTSSATHQVVVLASATYQVVGRTDIFHVLIAGG